MRFKVADYPGYAPLSFRNLWVPRTQEIRLELLREAGSTVLAV
jgi:hypothetical protein